MRQIAVLEDRAAAERFTAFLIVEGVDALVEPEDDRFAVWVREENHVPTARDAFQQFRQNPDHARYHGLEVQARKLTEAEDKRREASRKAVVDMSKRWRTTAGGGRTPVVTALIVICIGVALLTGIGRGTAAYQRKTLDALRICSIRDYYNAGTRHVIVGNSGLSLSWKGDAFGSIRRGQVWRLFSPALVHFDMLHIAFNLMMFYNLGRILERRHGALALLLLILGTALLSNVAQAIVPVEWDDLFSSGPFFGGMSGVVYGLFGFAWMRSTHDPAAGYYLPPTSVLIMLVWLVVCFTPLLPNIANMAHLVGLLAGSGAGYVTTGRF